MDLTQEQWALIEPLIPKHKVRKDRRGRPWQNDREVLEGILWILRTGAPWKDLPGRYPARATCHRRFQQWSRDGTFKKIWRALVHQMDASGKLDWTESFIDGSFASAKKGGLVLVKLRGERAPSGWQSPMVTASLLALLSTQQHLSKQRSSRRQSSLSRLAKSPRK
jgi:transposase